MRSIMRTKGFTKTGKELPRYNSLTIAISNDITAMLSHYDPALLTLTAKQRLSLKRKIRSIIRKHLIKHTDSFYLALAKDVFNSEAGLQHQLNIYQWAKKHLFSNSVAGLMYHLQPLTQQASQTKETKAEQ